MARPKKVVGGMDTQSQILLAAKAEIALNGFNIRLDDVADRCQIKRPSLLHHFSSKQVLIEAVIEQVIVQTRQAIVEATQAAKGDYSATIYAIAQTLSQIEVDEKGIAAIILHVLLSPQASDELKQMIEQLIKFVSLLAKEADTQNQHSAEQTQAVISHLVMGELCRNAFGAEASRYWGDENAVWPLVQSFFFSPHKSV